MKSKSSRSGNSAAVAAMTTRLKNWVVVVRCSVRAGRGLGGDLLFAASEVARLCGLGRGFRVIANASHDGGQEVDHLHLHVLGGKRLGRMLAPL